MRGIALFGAIAGIALMTAGQAAAIPVTSLTPITFNGTQGYAVYISSNAGVNAGAIGGGIGLAASAIENIDPTKARAVAACVARSGTGAIRHAFVAGIVQAGGSRSLATIAGAADIGHRSQTKWNNE